MTLSKSWKQPASVSYTAANGTASSPADFASASGKLTFALPTLYPTLLRLEDRGWIKGRWIEKPGQRRRCFYRLTPAGRRILATQRETWKAFIGAVRAVMGTSHA